jgi:hypothetical protein
VLLSDETLEFQGRRAPLSGRDAAVWGAYVLAAWNGVTGIFGLVRWYLGQPSRGFWIAVRVGQALAVAYAALAGILLVAGERPGSGLYWLYALLPIAIGFVAEQLRLAAADQVLAAHDIEHAQEVADLPESEQQAIVLAVLRREMIVMALAAVVVCGLALRAAGTY